MPNANASPRYTPTIPTPSPIVVDATSRQLDGWQRAADHEGMTIDEWLIALAERELARQAAT